MKTQQERKTLGAYYTDEAIAQFLVGWAVCCVDDAVLDPSFGEGVFLREACERIQTLGGNPSAQVLGFEVAEDTYNTALIRLQEGFGLCRDSLHCCDFFEAQPHAHSVDAVVGNPPFIRYQRFNGSARDLALERAASQGVRLSELTSSWAPFLVHSISMLRNGGRLAMVVPSEMNYARYARPVLDHLAASFGRITFLTFREKLFPELNERTMLLLADNKGSGESAFFWRELSRLTELKGKASEWGSPGYDGFRRIDKQALCAGTKRLTRYLLPQETLALYGHLKKGDQVQGLGNFAYVGIGYVTGANDFFHVGPHEADVRGFPDFYLRKAVRRGRAFGGIRFTGEDWQRAVEAGDAAYLLHIPPDAGLPSPIAEYISEGESQGVCEAYKCRNRNPWYSVPNVECPDAFLTYMSGVAPRLVANATGAVTPNNMHVVRIHPLTNATPDALAACFCTSLSRLSAELEGHALGGGMLKLEPTEARRVLLPVPPAGQLDDLAKKLDGLCRDRGWEAANRLGDEVILRGELGLSKADCRLLREGADLLMRRRYPPAREEQHEH